MEKSHVQEMYEEHHRTRRGEGFTILQDDRREYFKKLVGKNKRVLDLGCRDGGLTSAFLDGNTVLGVDVDQEALGRAAKLGFETKFMDLLGDWHEVEGRTFDVIVAGELLEHLFYPEKIALKVRERLTPDGMFVGSVPNAFSLKNRIRYLFANKKNTPMADPTHITQFGATDLGEMLLQVFPNVHVTGLGRYSRLARMFPSLCAFDLVFIAKK